MIYTDRDNGKIYDSDRDLVLSSDGGAYKHYYFKIWKKDISAGILAERADFKNLPSFIENPDRSGPVAVWNIVKPLGGILGMTTEDTREALIGLLKEYESPLDRDIGYRVEFVFGQMNFFGGLE